MPEPRPGHAAETCHRNGEGRRNGGPRAPVVAVRGPSWSSGSKEDIRVFGARTTPPTGYGSTGPNFTNSPATRTRSNTGSNNQVSAKPALTWGKVADSPARLYRATSSWISTLSAAGRDMSRFLSQVSGGLPDLRIRTHRRRENRRRPRCPRNSPTRSTGPGSRRNEPSASSPRGSSRTRRCTWP